MPDYLPPQYEKDPFFRFPNVFQQIEQFVNEGNNQGISVYEEKNTIVVEAAMPGLSLNDIDVSMNNGILWIKGSKKEEESEKDKKFYQKSSRSFSYTISLDKKIDENQEPKASYKDGILKIVFEKSKKTEAKKINVKTE